ncbi:complement factor H-like [Toxotes jaculatrix]|uniref:complement factor H-like n=1 Tax=Toxotes jaculatrix TaxID=941984 RepID=UPI001B3A84E8|nr:complement factor H-like [Toxotes jaculatrix]
MHILTRVLFLWVHMLTFVKSQDCTLQQFLSGPLYDSNFDTTGLEASYPGGKQVRVSCSIGYSGFFRLVCVEGKWQSRGTRCQPRPCGHPGDAQFADFHLEKGDDFVFGSQVVYTCHKGYQMISRTSSRRCMAEGWDGVVPVCEALQCPVIHVNNNVQVIGDPEEATYGNVLRFRCKSNAEILFGASEIYCNEHGEWSEDAPTCKEIKCAVVAIEHGFVVGDVQEYKEHEILHFTCNRGYKRTEDRPSKCTKLGLRAEWSPTPACEPITCKLSLPPLEGTTYEPAYRNVFSPGDTVRVTCGDKHFISQPQKTSAESTCTEEGQWTIRPVCQVVTCSNQRDRNVYYWSVTWGEIITLGETASYRCSRGYRKPVGINLAECTRNGWSPDPLCEEITCDRLDVQNAILGGSKQKYRSNEWATYYCKEGYRGQFSLTCTESGWRGNPDCTPITCNRQHYQHADIVGIPQSVYQYKDKVEYVCKNGYVGSFSLTCEEGGWTGSRQCSERQCKRPEISNAYVIRNDKESYNSEERVQYACRNDMEKRFTVTCEQGRWIGIQNCFGCPEADVPNGFTVGPYNETLYYSCNDGYKFSTKGWWRKATCDGRSWSGFDQCIEKSQCGEIPVIPNGKVESQNKVYDHGENLKITCKTGYTPEPDDLICQEGKWRSDGPLKAICTPIEKHCGPPSKVENAVILTSYQREYLSGSEVTYQCRDNYTLEGEATIRCNNGKWEKRSINCTLKPCQLPDDTPNGYYQIIQGEDFVFGTTIKYYCNEGYQMVSKTDTRICLLDKWTNHVPVCEPLSCDHPPIDEGITVRGLPENDDPILPDRFLTFSCEGRGKYLNGSSVLICGKDGQWDNPFPTCEEITCKAGVMHPHLRVVDSLPANKTVKIGEMLRFYCDNDYNLEGSAVIQCLQTGQWNVPFPTCREKCRVTGIPDNVNVSPSVRQLTMGQKLTFSCRLRSHVIRGAAEVKCLANGQWSDTFPTCGAPLGCGRPPALADGDTKETIQFRYRHNDRVEFICQNFYVMQGGPFKTCLNGEWTGEITCLKPCTVDRELMSRYNIAFRYTYQDKLYSAHNDVIEFACRRGRHTGSLGMRQKCIDGVIHLPSCQ